MKLLIWPVLALLALGGCATPTPEGIPPATPKPDPKADELRVVWESEVDDAVAGFTAIRPRLTSVESPVLALYDAQLEGLKALAGAPLLPAVEAKVAVLGNPDPSVIARLLEEKKRLDAKTNALEGQVASAKREAELAREAKAESDRQARLAEQAKDLSRAGTWAMGLGILAFLMGHWLRIPKWVAASTVGLGLGISTFGGQLLEFFGSAHFHTILLASFGLLALAAVVGLGWLLIDWVKDKVSKK